MSACCVPEPMQSTGDTEETETDFFQCLPLCKDIHRLKNKEMEVMGDVRAQGKGV